MKSLLRRSFQHVVRKHRALKQFTRVTVRNFTAPAWMVSQPAVAPPPHEAVLLSEQLTGSAMWAPYYDLTFLRSIMVHP